MVDVVARFKIIQSRGCPALALRYPVKASETQCFSNTRLINHETGDAASRELVAYRKINHLLDAIEAIAKKRHKAAGQARFP